MGTKTEVDVLREEIAGLSEKKQARRYPAGLKRRVTRWAARKVAAGASIAGLCEQLDIGEPTLTRFLEAERAKVKGATASFARVTVLEAAPTSSTSIPERVVLRGPHEVAVELSVETLAKLLKRLSCSD
jgi:transposase-like protein